MENSFQFYNRISKFLIKNWLLKKIELNIKFLFSCYNENFVNKQIVNSFLTKNEFFLFGQLNDEMDPSMKSCKRQMPK